MYTITYETLKKLVDAHNMLNQIEIKGMQNIQLLYNSIFNLQEVIKTIDEQTKSQQIEGIKIDNTKDSKKGE